MGITVSEGRLVTVPSFRNLLDSLRKDSSTDIYGGSEIDRLESLLVHPHELAELVAALSKHELGSFFVMLGATLQNQCL